jgi:hypothetical protein
MRAQHEYKHWKEDRDAKELKEQDNLERRKSEHIEKLRQAKVDAMHRATAKREQLRRNALRERKIEEISEKRMRKFRETQYLEQKKAALTMNFDEPAQEGEGDEEEGEKTELMETTLSKAEKKEQKEFDKTFEQQQRAERRRQRAEREKQEVAKKEQLDKLGAKDPAAKEVARIRQWFREDDERKQSIEEAKLAREIAKEEMQRQKLEKDRLRVETFEALEKVRREKSREREIIRNEGCIARVKDAKTGNALPRGLLAF